MRIARLLTIIAALLIAGSAPVSASSVATDVANILGQAGEDVDPSIILSDLQAINLSQSTTECTAFWGIAYVSALALDAVVNGPSLGDRQYLAVGVVTSTIAEDLLVTGLTECMISEM